MLNLNLMLLDIALLAPTPDVRFASIGFIADLALGQDANYLLKLAKDAELARDEILLTLLKHMPFGKFEPVFRAWCEPAQINTNMFNYAFAGAAHWRENCDRLMEFAPVCRGVAIPHGEEKRSYYIENITRIDPGAESIIGILNELKSSNAKIAELTANLDNSKLLEDIAAKNAKIAELTEELSSLRLNVSGLINSSNDSFHSVN